MNRSCAGQRSSRVVRAVLAAASAVRAARTAHTTRAALLAPLAALPLLLAAPPAAAHDYPTAERVLYVQECLRENPGPNFEMIHKCSCALDHLAGQVTLDDYVTMSTISKAMSIGGERGNDLRDNESLKAPLKRFRDVQAAARKACMFPQR